MLRFSCGLQLFPLVATSSEISLVFWLLFVESTIHSLYSLVSNLLLAISGEISPLSFVNWVLSCFSRSISICHQGYFYLLRDLALFTPSMGVKCRSVTSLGCSSNFVFLPNCLYSSASGTIAATLSFGSQIFR